MNISRLLFFVVFISSIHTLANARALNDTTVVVNRVHRTALVELTDKEYPNNPDKKYRSNTYSKVDYNEVIFDEVGEGRYNIEFVPMDEKYPKVAMEEINLMEFIPTIPEYVRDDEYLSLLSVVNQEWNRNQITFRNNLFTIEPGKKAHKHRISRVDVARSCLNSYLWEAFFYTYNPVWGKHELMYHGWFTFPKGLYQKLFEKRNNIQFDKYAENLEEWKDLPSELIDFESLRSVISERTIAYEDLSDEMYPIEGERKKKEDEIVFPRNPRRMTDFHTDKAKFSSFVEPGMYVKKEKRLTQLSRFQKLEKSVVRETQNGDQRLQEIELSFSNDKGQETILTIGGIDLMDISIVLDEKVNDGDLFSMGIGNHTFYENYHDQQSYSSLDNPYFGILTDEKGNYLDSHFVGIDGPLLHRDSKDQDILHIWLLSYERHALVGHYKLKVR